ncbi:MAG: glycosyltransferase [Acidimicrobiales bacterium]
MDFTKGASREFARWTPIPIVQVDLDAMADVVIDGASVGQRVWVEVIKNGQIVGIIEAAVTEFEGLSASELQSLTSSFADITPPEHVAIPDDMLPMASIVVPTICRDSYRLNRTIESLLALDYPNYEIIVVDNRPDSQRVDDLTLPGGSKVRIFQEPKRGVSAARNRGITNAIGEFVAFTDDDVVVELNWLRELGTRFVCNPEVDGIGGLVLPVELRTQSQLWFEEFFGGFKKTYSLEILSDELVGTTDELFPYAAGRFGAGCNMAIRRSALEKNGTFNVTLGTGTPSRGGEDLALLMKQVLTGGSLAFEPRAVVRHEHRESQGTFLSQVFGYGTGLTAMYTALILQDPRHLARMLRRIPGAYRLLTKPRNERSPSSSASYPRRAYVWHTLGMMYGPFAYARSVARFLLKD